MDAARDRLADGPAASRYGKGPRAGGRRRQRRHPRRARRYRLARGGELSWRSRRRPAADRPGRERQCAGHRRRHASAAGVRHAHYRHSDPQRLRAVVELLLSRGADAKIAGKDTALPVRAAMDPLNLPVLRLLLKQGAAMPESGLGLCAVGWSGRTRRGTAGTPGTGDAGVQGCARRLDAASSRRELADGVRDGVARAPWRRYPCCGCRWHHALWPRGVPWESPGDGVSASPEGRLGAGERAGADAAAPGSLWCSPRGAGMAGPARRGSEGEGLPGAYGAGPCHRYPTYAFPGRGPQRTAGRAAQGHAGRCPARTFRGRTPA